MNNSPLSSDVLLTSPLENINSYIPNHLDIVLDKKKVDNEMSDSTKTNTDDAKSLNNSADSTSGDSTDISKYYYLLIYYIFIFLL